MLYQRGKIWHYDFWHKGRRYRGSTRHANRRKAALAEQREFDRISLGLDAPRQVTLKDAAASWWTHRGSHLASAVTVAHRLQILERVMDFGQDVCAVTTATVAEAMQARRREITHNGRAPTPSTINRDIIDTLRPVIRHAERVMEVPVQRIDWGAVRMKEPKLKVREFSAAEIEAILANLPEHYHPLVAFLSRYGCRISEAWFPLSAFDRDAGRVVLRVKGAKRHTIPLLDEDRRYLAAQASRAERAKLNTVWFRVEKTGELVPLRISSFQSAMRAAYARAGIRDARPAHDWRHHALTAYVRATGDIRAAQRLAGHENIATTARYAHAAEADILKGLKAASATPAPTEAGETGDKALKGKGSTGGT